MKAAYGFRLSVAASWWDDALKCCVSRQHTVMKATAIQNTPGLKSELTAPAYYVYISNLSGQMKGLMTVLVRTLLATNQA